MCEIASELCTTVFQARSPICDFFAFWLCWRRFTISGAAPSWLTGAPPLAKLMIVDSSEPSTLILEPAAYFQL